MMMSCGTDGVSTRMFHCSNCRYSCVMCPDADYFSNITRSDRPLVMCPECKTKLFQCQHCGYNTRNHLKDLERHTQRVHKNSTSAVSASAFQTNGLEMNSGSSNMEISFHDNDDSADYAPDDYEEDDSELDELPAPSSEYDEFIYGGVDRFVNEEEAGQDEFLRSLVSDEREDVPIDYGIRSMSSVNLFSLQTFPLFHDNSKSKYACVFSDWDVITNDGFKGESVLSYKLFDSINVAEE